MYLVRVGKDPHRVEFVRILRNHKDLLPGFIVQTEITKEQQAKYMEKHGEDYYICINDNHKQVGYVGVVEKDIRLAVLPEFQRQGYAEFMVRTISQRYDFKVKIKRNNIASQKLFTKLKLSFEFV
jgi:ribosomal protein S18 acetylase RimI-like enzyme